MTDPTDELAFREKFIDLLVDREGITVRMRVRVVSNDDLQLSEDLREYLPGPYRYAEMDDAGNL